MSSELLAKTLSGLEDLLAAELAQLGAGSIVKGTRSVSFTGDQRLLYQANICCRTAIRVLKPIHQFKAEKEQDIYEGVQSIDWSAWLKPDGSLAIDPVVISSFCTHSLYVAQLAKDAIVDQFRNRTGQRPSVDRDDPDLRINFHMNRNRATLYVDSSGVSLHQRGYRRESGAAPLNEVLAAGIVLLSGWNGEIPLLDPMCGSGTLLIEAAMLARRIVPGLLRDHYAFQKWPDYDRALFETVIAEARSAVIEQPSLDILGCDRDGDVLAVARRNADRAGVGNSIRLERREFSSQQPSVPAGILLSNPPYDERIKVWEIAAEYRSYGDILKQRFAGWSAYLLTGNLEAAKHVGLRPSRRIPLFNGPIECRLLRYDIFAMKIDARPKEGDEPAVVERERPRSSGPWKEQLEMFRNRLAKMTKHWSKWARRQSIGCFRLYDRDTPEFPFAIDWYEGQVYMVEFDRPHERTEAEQQRWLLETVDTVIDVLQINRDCLHFKQRARQRGDQQYERMANTNRKFVANEYDHKFLINLVDYLDTGLFLDHRQTRRMVEEQSAGKRVLNLFCYTGAFTVYAAAGGARSTVSVDLSANYLDWARANLRQNGLAGEQHAFFENDAFDFLTRYRQQRDEPFDIAIVDPPTFSNSKRLDRDWDVQRDYIALLNMTLDILSPGGRIFFSTNFRRFKFDESQFQRVSIREITNQTIPPDFRDKRIHRCWTLDKGTPTKH